MNRSVYLDYNATAPIRFEAAEAVARALRIGGNPSSVHAAGRAARAVIEEAREQVAGLVHAKPSDLVFTSGGAEANTLAIQSAATAGGCGRLILGATEHSSVMEAAKATGLPVELWPVDFHGVADLDWLVERLGRWSAAEGRPFVALMLANNETGVIQPVVEAARLVHDAGGWMHVDAIQGVGKIAVDMGALGADTLTLSAHKLGGPQGVGALLAGPNAVIARRIHGGGQERGLRAGTENVSGIAGFGAAAATSLTDLGAHQGAWRDAAAERLKREADVTVMGEGAPRLPNTLCFAARGFSSELQLMSLDLAGVMVSAGSACSSGKMKPSHVIVAMGRPDLASCTLRVSSGWSSIANDWTAFADAWLDAFARHADRAPKLVEA